MPDESQRPNIPDRRLTAEDIDLIALGAGVLGSGGGGSTYLGRLLALHAAREGRSITLSSLSRVVEGALLVAVAQVGAPVVLAERLATGVEAVRACEALEAHLGEKAVAVVCDEIGGINSMIPLLVAAHRGIPLVDADAMGRAFPGMHQDTFSIYSSRALPVAFCDDEGNTAILQAVDAGAVERLGRGLTTAMGGLAYVAQPVPRDVPLDRVLIPGTYSRARAIGLALRRAQQIGDVQSIDLDTAGGHLLFSGIIHAVERRPQDDGDEPVKGMLSIAGQGPKSMGLLRIGFQSEYLIAWHGDTLLATTPDVISVVNDETGEPISTEALQIGLRVIVLHLAADARLSTAQALKSVGPAAFGYNAEYLPMRRRSR